MLDILQDTKADIKLAILNQNVDVEGGLVTYGDAIRKIKNYETTNVLPAGTKMAYSRSDEIFTQLDFSNITDCEYMFYLSSFQNVKNFNVKSRSWNWAFYKNTNLLTVNGLNTGTAEKAIETFYGCSALTSIDVIDGSNLIDAGAMFYGCSSLTDFGGIKNLGKCGGLYGVNYPRVNVGYMFNQCNALTRESAVNIFNNLYDLKLVSDGVGTAPPYDFASETIYLPTVVLDRLTDEDIAIATAKNWYVAGSNSIYESNRF